MALAVLKEARYYGLVELEDRMAVLPSISALIVKESHRAQFPDYQEVRIRKIYPSINPDQMRDPGLCPICMQCSDGHTGFPWFESGRLGGVRSGPNRKCNQLLWFAAVPGRSCPIIYKFSVVYCLLFCRLLQ